MANKIDNIISLLSKEFKTKKSHPHKSDPLDMLIATMLSQNTTDKTSYIAFKNLKTRFKDWEDVLNLPINRVKEAIKVCGLVNQKAKNIRNLLRKLKKKHGKLSLDYIQKMNDNSIYNEFLQYKGVGLKTISCVLAFGLGRDVFPVDTHIHRVSNRLGLVHTKSPEKTFEQMTRIVPDGKKYMLHTMLIKFGRKICRSRNPLCGKCVLFDICEYKDKELFAMQENVTNKIPKENNFIVLEHVSSI